MNSDSVALLRRLFAWPGMTVHTTWPDGVPEFVLPMEHGGVGLHEHLGLTEEEFVDLLPARDETSASADEVAS